jgi:DNA-directed RNA polymerase subunit RPC12/RpoP
VVSVSAGRPAGEAATGERFPCEQCGALLTYAPGTEDLVCAYCGHRNRIVVAAVEIVENDLGRALRQVLAAAPVEETATVKCGACAAEFSLPEGHHAGACPFCGSSVVTATPGNRHIKPAALLPFAIAAGEAQARLRRWLRGLWLAPSKLKDFARDGRLSGVYLPYWTFDSRTETDYAGQRGTIYHESVRVPVTRNGRTVIETRTVQKVRWTPVRGHVSRAFDDVLVPASRSLPEPLLDALEPWDLHDLRPYTTAFLSGFQAEAYQLAVDQGFAVAQGKMRAALQQDVMADIGGDLQRIERMDVTHRRPSFKHVLLPVWLGAYRFKGRVFRLCVNGRTGEVQGERPWSAWKVLGAILLALLLAALVAYLYGHLPPPEL